jgi:hypothetical protein
LLLAGIAFGGTILVTIGAAPGTYMVRRAASQYETVLYYFAQNVGEPSLCDHISWAAYARYSVIFGGGGASYDRSDCYERVAEARYHSSVCWRVRPLVDFDPLYNEKAIYYRNSLFALWPTLPPDPGEPAHQASSREAAEEAREDEARTRARQQLVARLTELSPER